MPVVGFIRSTSADTSMPLVAAFRKGLAEAGFVEGKDVAIELALRTTISAGCLTWRAIWCVAV